MKCLSNFDVPLAELMKVSNVCSKWSKLKGSFSNLMRYYLIIYFLLSVDTKEMTKRHTIDSVEIFSHQMTLFELDFAMISRLL